MPRLSVDRDERLIDFLRRRLPEWKATTIKQRLKNGLVVVDGAPERSGAFALRGGQTVEIIAKPSSPASFFPPDLGDPPLPILYADDSLLAVDKPSGLLSVASERERNLTAIRTMREWLSEMDPRAGRDLHAAHRLDRDASGVLLLARSTDIKRRLAADWRRFEKVYLAVVDGVPPAAEGTLDAPLWEDRGLFVRVAEKGRGEEALTHYRLLRNRGERSLLEVRLGTGRKHQIRVHLAHMGCPIVGDLRYGVSKASRLALHAHRLSLYHPDDGGTVEITAEMPGQFRMFLNRG